VGLSRAKSRPWPASVQAVVGELVDVTASSPARHVPDAGGQVLEAEPAVRKQRDLEDDPPRSAEVRHVHLHAAGQVGAGWMLDLAVAALGGTEAVAFEACPGRLQRSASVLGQTDEVGFRTARR